MKKYTSVGVRRRTRVYILRAWDYELKFLLYAFHLTLTPPVSSDVKKLFYKHKLLLDMILAFIHTMIDDR